MNNETQPLLEVTGLVKHFPLHQGIFNRVVGQIRAVDGVDFTLFPGECLGLVGESGSGKTTVGRAILRAIQPDAGKVLFNHDGNVTDLAIAHHAELRPLRSHMQLIFQDPYSSLNPRMTIAEIIGEPLLIHGMRNRHQREDRVRELLGQVGLQEQHIHCYPHAFSGGQRQRIGIARALALAPELIIADEPVSALDISMQAQVLNLLQELQQRLQLTYLFISHDLGVIRHIADRVAIIYLGRIVEMTAVETLFNTPAHPYTEMLLAAKPTLNISSKRDRIPIGGEAADPAHPPTGCHFHPRCRYAQERCQKETPQLRQLTPDHQVRCHRAEDLTLAGLA